MPPDVDVEKIARDIYAGVVATHKEIVAAKGLKGYGLIIPLVLAEVEEYKNTTASLTGPQKKDVASRVLNLLVNLPIVPEWVEAKVFSLVIDWFVEFFNRSFTNGWLGKVRELLGK